MKTLREFKDSVSTGAIDDTSVTVEETTSADIAQVDTKLNLKKKDEDEEYEEE